MCCLISFFEATNKQEREVEQKQQQNNTEKCHVLLPEPRRTIKKYKKFFT
jgi:hypothetical protein